MRDLEDHTLIVLLIAVSVAFAWILWPFYGAILWATVLAIVFAPLYRWLSISLGGQGNLAAVASLLIIVTMVILPLTLTAASLLQEATNLYETIESGQMDFGQFIQQVIDALPSCATDILNRLGLTDLSTIQPRLSAVLVQGSKTIAAQALNVGKGTANFIISLFIMLYLLFFFLRDGTTLSRRIKDAIPLPAEQKRELFTKFTIVTRAMFKGTLLVAIVQGALGGFIFWVLGIHAPVLWGVVMGLFSLLPAVGAAIVWLPVAIYFLATGAIWEGVVLLAFGGFVIGLVDNLLRPFLVGKDTELPDFVVLISTLGGIAIFGLNGFVIGPVIAAMFIAVWDIFSASRRSTE
ncbi:MAG TPA: AI-2E family transporter [Methyloceanibacter sp.]|nr:AI-2E family transporter [Methyloceanibacter sp.]